MSKIHEETDVGRKIEINKKKNYKREEKTEMYARKSNEQKKRNYEKEQGNANE